MGIKRGTGPLLGDHFIQKTAAGSPGGTESISGDLVRPAPGRSGKGRGSWPLWMHEVACLGGERTEASLEKHWSLEPRKGGEESEEGRERRRTSQGPGFLWSPLKGSGLYS